MINIVNNKDIECTQGDSFNVIISPSDEEQFAEGTTLRLIVAKTEASDPHLSKSISINSEGLFELELSRQEIDKLIIGDYIYKLTLIDADGTTITQKSGEFLVKWGA